MKNEVDLSYCPHRISEPLVAALASKPEEEVYDNLSKGRDKLAEDHKKKVDSLLATHRDQIKSIIAGGGTLRGVATALSVPRSMAETLVYAIFPGYIPPKVQQILDRKRIIETKGEWIKTQLVLGVSKKDIGDQLGIKKDLMCKIIKEMGD